VEQLLDRVAVWGEAGAIVLFGAVLVIMAIEGYIKGSFRPAETLARLSSGASLIAIGLFYLLDFARKDLIWLGWMTVLGMLFLMEGIGILSVSLTGGMRKWLSVLSGSAFLLWSLSNALTHFR